MIITWCRRSSAGFTRSTCHTTQHKFAIYNSIFHPNRSLKRRYVKKSVDSLSRQPGVPSQKRRDSNNSNEVDHIISALVVNRPGTLAQIAAVFGYADHNISDLCVRSTAVPELSRVTISCRMSVSEVGNIKKRLKALVCITFFHITTMQSCVENQELLLRSQALLHVQCKEKYIKQLEQLMEEYDAEVVFGDDSSVIPEEGLSTVTSDELIYDENLKQYETKDQHSMFVHIVNDPVRIQAFVQAIKGTSGIVLHELQSCGPLFLDISQSTLATETKSSFSRTVAHEIEQYIDHPDQTDTSYDEDIYRHKPLTTYQLYSKNQGYFTQERLRLHARIAHQLYESIPQHRRHPKFILLIGIPGSGKTTILSHLETTQQLNLSEFVNLDVDDVIALLPEFYHTMLNIGLGNDMSTPLPTPQQRYLLCRDEARFILKKNLEHAIMCRRNIILHGSGKSYHYYREILEQVQASGYEPHVVCLDVPLQVAYDRIEKRSNRYGRNVPKALVDFAACMLPRTFKRLIQGVPNAHLFMNDMLSPRLIWSKQHSQIVVCDAEARAIQEYGLVVDDDKKY